MDDKQGRNRNDSRGQELFPKALFQDSLTDFIFLNGLSDLFLAMENPAVLYIKQGEILQRLVNRL